MSGRVMSPNAPQHEIDGMQLAENLLTLPCRAGWSRRQVLSFGEQVYTRYCAVGRGDKGDGFRRMAVIIAQTRGLPSGRSDGMGGVVRSAHE